MFYLPQRSRQEASLNSFGKLERPKADTTGTSLTSARTQENSQPRHSTSLLTLTQTQSIIIVLKQHVLVVFSHAKNAFLENQ